MNCLRIPSTHSTVYTWYSSEIHLEFMTHGGLARSIYRQGRSPRVCADDLNALSKYQTISARTFFTCPNYNLNILPSPARTISTCPSYTQSHVNACIEYYFKIRGWWCISLNQYRHNTQPPPSSQLYGCKKNT